MSEQMVVWSCPECEQITEDMGLAEQLCDGVSIGGPENFALQDEKYGSHERMSMERIPVAPATKLEEAERLGEELAARIDQRVRSHSRIYRVGGAPARCVCATCQEDDAALANWRRHREGVG